MTFTRTSAHTVARLHAAVIGAAALAALSSTTLKASINPGTTVSLHKRRFNTSPPHAAASTEGVAKNFREAKKADIIDGKATLGDTSGEHGVSKKLSGEGKAMAKKDGSNDKAGILRVGHHVTVQRGRVNGSSVRRATANGGWTRHAA